MRFFVIVVISLFLLTSCKTEEELMMEVESVDLTQEGIGIIALGDFLDEDLFELTYDADNTAYHDQRTYDQYHGDIWSVEVDRMERTIQTIIVNKRSEQFATDKGIQVMDSEEMVMSAYGELSYRYEDREQQIVIIGNVDRVHQLHLRFHLYDGEVYSIWFSELEN